MKETVPRWVGVCVALTVPVRVQGDLGNFVIVTQGLRGAVAGGQGAGGRLRGLQAHAPHRGRPGQHRVCGGAPAVRCHAACRIPQGKSDMVSSLCHCVSGWEKVKYCKRSEGSGGYRVLQWVQAHRYGGVKYAQGEDFVLFGARNWIWMRLLFGPQGKYGNYLI